GRERMYFSQIIKPNYCSSGYLKVCLYDKEGNRYTPKVHSLVARHFIHNPNPEVYRFVNYRIEDPTNVAADNLYWASEAESCAKGAKSHMKKIVAMHIDSLKTIHFNSLV